MGVRLGAVGLGGLGGIELDLYGRMDGVTVVAGTDVSGAARAAFEEAHDAPAYADHEAMLAAHDLDAVSIATPHALHYDQAMASLKADADVFVEKPLATDLRDAVALVDVARDRDRVLQVGYQRHFDPVFEELRRVVSSGHVGEVHAVDAYLGQDWIDIQRGTWRTDPALAGGGQLYDSGSHLLDALLWTLDATPRSVAAVTDDRGEAVDVNAALAATLGRDGGTVTASVGIVGDGTGADPEEALVVWGTDGHVRLVDGGLEVVTDAWSYEGTPSGDRDFETLTRRKLADFVAAVAGESDPTVPGTFGLRVTAFAEAAAEAAATGRTVDVPARLDGARNPVPTE